MPDGPMLYLDRELPADMMAVLGPRANLTGPGEDALTRADGVIAGASRWDGPRMDARSAAAGDLPLGHRLRQRRRRRGDGPRHRGVHRADRARPCRRPSTPSPC